MLFIAIMTFVAVVGLIQCVCNELHSPLTDLGWNVPILRSSRLLHGGLTGGM